MKNGKQETTRYTIEREFLAKITVTELVNRIIQTHVKKLSEKEVVSPWKSNGKIRFLVVK